MAHQVETMAYAGATPWHGLGRRVGADMTPAEMLVAAQLDWSVSKRHAYCSTQPYVTNIFDPAASAPIMLVKDQHFIVRDSDNSVLAPCGSAYTPFQNAEVMSFFDKFCKAGKMTMETAGSLKLGREIWALAKVTDGFTLPGNDQVGGYMLLNNSHAPGKAMIIMFTAIRVVCNNTLQMALNTKSGTKFKVPHMQMFDAEVQRAAELALGLSGECMGIFQQQAEFLASRPAKQFDVDNWLAEILQPQLLVERAKADNQAALPPLHEQFGRTAQDVKQAIELSPGADMRSAKGTWWGALNGLTDVVDNKKGATSNGLYSAWFGTGSAVKRKGLVKALEYAQ